MSRPHFVAVLLILFVGFTIGCADTKTSPAPTKSPGSKPVDAKPVTGGAVTKNAVSKEQPKTPAKEIEAAKTDQTEVVAKAQDMPAKAPTDETQPKTAATNEKAGEQAPAPEGASKRRFLRRKQNAWRRLTRWGKRVKRLPRSSPSCPQS